MKKWLTERFLPMWAKETVYTQCRHLQGENDALRRQNRELKAYIRGMRAGQERRRHSENT